MPLSQGPESEAQTLDVYEWTDGRALLATEGRGPPVTLSSGKIMEPSQCSSTYIFPGRRVCKSERPCCICLACKSPVLI